MVSSLCPKLSMTDRPPLIVPMSGSAYSYPDFEGLCAVLVDARSQSRAAEACVPEKKAMVSTRPRYSEKLGTSCTCHDVLRFLYISSGWWIPKR